MNGQEILEQSPFSSLDLDDRLLKALGTMNLVHMTKVQEESIPLGLAGKDLIVQARTGSGKTAAYGLVLLNKILKSLHNSRSKKLGTKAIVLVPTLELCEQVSGYLKKLSASCAKFISIINAGSGGVPHAIKALLAEQPEVVVSTPSRILQHMKEGSLNVSESLETLVIDEADLILSFGYKNDLFQISEFLPRMCQTLLMSATLPTDVNELSQLVLRNPVKCIVNDEVQNHSGRLMQYVVMCTDKEKFFLTFVVLKLKLISGKCILFVNGVDRCYRLKLFLEQFSIKSCVLNSDLPINSRYHIVEEFNRGMYDYIIATDEGAGREDNENEQDPKTEKSEHDEDTILESDDDDSSDEETQSKEKVNEPTRSKKEISAQKAKEAKKRQYGVVRGIDFKNVSVVINFDFPTSVDAYTHRIGRTARGNRRGMSLSFVAAKADNKSNEKVDTVAEKKMFERVKAHQKSRGCTIEPYEFDMNQISGLKYRCEDALRAVTKALIREAQIKEMKRELLNSKVLKTHFEDKPTDLEFLRHDKTLHPTKIQPHLKNIPNYLMPKIASVNGDPSNNIIGTEENSVGFVPFMKNNNGKKRRNHKDDKSNKRFKSNPKKRSSDPLKSFGSKKRK
ncbi:hypothetical protein BB558_004308 [Smittium angustum]|uniref:RNA helicase n=1 Tax=Smittium angustum TaxID=133377 RepID=A0A2U1J3R5_SMIAN|nr:hypothetical protein BB558_004308 [Smittium angustum]